ncbi:M56 family metallopeptidase [Massilia sp. IC2-477]|uniref:M56 family metallopeptidase n=1 Tax=Massilia sp. IC2-477 TaxID=2887198 RepID=UPI001D0FC068|nr:M56 family metallopeptidase [Massilia sp. IC2-477]MCC2956885.1 M56 family metallopeptidase [Massilia sp. IC2-477]
MMASELMPLVLRAALFASLAILVLLVARRPLRRWLGAALAYQAWLLVPLVVAASMLPARPAAVLQSVQVLRPVQALTAQATTPPSAGQADTLLLVWAGGLVLTALWFALGQRAFLRQADAGVAGPASIGLFRPRIVVPQDFTTRYSPPEQALVLAHERAHIARGDLYANLLATLFQCVFWFNPLVHLAVRRFRQDQELACDAVVMQQHPQQRRTYAEALLKSHTGARMAAGLHCHWQSPHPTKERIMSLQHTSPGTLRRAAGRCILALLAMGAFTATLGARAEQAASTAASRYSIALDMKTVSAPDTAVTLKADSFVIKADSFVQEEKRTIPRIVTAAGQQFAVASGEWRVEMTARPGDAPDQVWLAGKLLKGTNLVSEPRLLTRLGDTATIKVGDGSGNDFSIAMTVTQQP